MPNHIKTKLVNRVSTKGSRRGLIAAVVAAVLGVSGASLIAVSIASQERAPQPPAPMGVATAVADAVGAMVASLPVAVAPPERSPSEMIEPTLPRSKPVSMDIPSIGVHSVVQSLGQAANGALETPAGAHYNEAAWYRYSPTPGSLGPAIILGHVDSASDGPSVFFRLSELRPGDRVSIKRADDSTAVFVVDEVHQYAKNDFPTRLVYSDIDHAGLRILTCGGAFDDSTGHYLDNIVVFASLVDGNGAAQ